MHATTVLRLALPCLALALFGTAEGHSKLEKRRQDSQEVASTGDYIPDNVRVLYEQKGGTADNFSSWYSLFYNVRAFRVSLIQYDSSFDLQEYAADCSTVVKKDVMEPAKNSSLTTIISCVNGKLPGWSAEDGIHLIMAQAFTVPVQKPGVKTFQSSQLHAFSDRAAEVVDSIKKKGLNVSIVATNATVKGVIEEAGKKGIHIPKGSPISLSDSKQVVEKGDKHGAKEDKDDEKWSNGEEGKKGEASHKHKKASKHP